MGLIVYYKHILEAITHIIFTLKYFITKTQVYVTTVEFKEKEIKSQNDLI